MNTVEDREVVLPDTCPICEDEAQGWANHAGKTYVIPCGHILRGVS